MNRNFCILAALGALSLGSIALAQSPDAAPGGPMRGERGRGGRDPLQHILQALDLTADQKAKAQPIMDEARPKMEEIRREAAQKSRAVMEDAMAKIRPLLTADQLKKLDEAKNERRNQQGRTRHGGNGNNANDAGANDDDQ